MCSAAKLHSVAEFHYSDLVSVFFTEQCDCAHCIGLFHCRVPLFHERIIGTDQFIDPLLHFFELLVGHFGEMREVETEIVRAYIRTFLLNVCAEHLSQCPVEKMGCSMVVRDFQPSRGIDMKRE